ncbi:N-acetyltransferase [Trinickia terrae]|uniref:N-acetyltransferase n=1 Tax=Trinickia terrae TaxID=2571161 RepID=A0A4U1I2D6_9BURK|nr:N-acetyltransferase [Trinickia terrae]TKC87338.1 N-acetyltransferase [Trinickia terrae]
MTEAPRRDAALRIRVERVQDAAERAAISGVVRAAFESHPHSDQSEHLLVDTLRDDGALTVSLVAELAGEIVGYIAFSPVQIGSYDAGKWVGLAPVAVLPAYQGQGIGGALIAAGLAAVREQGAEGCVVLGDPAYYTRFGFRHESAIVFPGVPAEYFMAMSLIGGEGVNASLPGGEARYHPAFYPD